MTNVLETVRAEDFVEYYLLLITHDANFDKKLQEIYDQIFVLINPIIQNYIWHKDEFNLFKVTDLSSEVDLPHLHGIIHYGENLDDEWFLVYLLMKISKEITDVCIRIVDSDGEFLLIEAANYLPKWMKPETCNRGVYLYNGTVRILLSPDSNDKIVSVSEVITRLNEINNISSVEQIVTQCINKRIEKYSNLSDLLHRSRVYLPVKVAALLDVKPNLIASAITAFSQRDLIDMRECRKMEHFPPKDVILRLVTFTKFLYAMISSQKMNPVRKMNWSMPNPSDPNYKGHLLGFKITCGFEILASRCDKKSKNDPTLSKKWNQYVEVLKRKSYFKDLLEGSKEYTELEKKARLYFLDNVGIEESRSSYVLNILQTVQYNLDDLKQEESQLPLSDDESWMEVNEEEFNKLLQEQFGFKSMNVTNSPEVLSSTINKFLNCVSDIEGVEFKNSDHDLNSSSSMDVDDDYLHNSVSFHSDEFLSSVQKMLGIMKVDSEDLSENENSDLDSDTSLEYLTGNDERSKDLCMKSYMNLMDKELEPSTLSKSFTRKPKINESENTNGAVDVDTNALENILKSYQEQFSGSGPATNLVHSLGLKLNANK